MVDDRERVQASLEAAGVPTAIHYPYPLNEQPAYRDISVFGPLPNSERAAARVLSIPMHAYLDEATQDRIVDAVAAAL